MKTMNASPVRRFLLTDRNQCVNANPPFTPPVLSRFPISTAAPSPFGDTHTIAHLRWHVALCRDLLIVWHALAL